MARDCHQSPSKGVAALNDITSTSSSIAEPQNPNLNEDSLIDVFQGYEDGVNLTTARASPD
jgi:hypothetical protein